MHLVKDDTSSLLCLRDADSFLSRQSIVSESSSNLDTIFEFDREIFNSKPYQEVIRSALSRKNKGKMPQRPKPFLPNATNGVGYECSSDITDYAQIDQNKSMDPERLNDASSNLIIQKSNQADGPTLVARKKKAGMFSQFRGPTSEKARRLHPDSWPGAVLVQRKISQKSKYIEDDAETAQGIIWKGSSWRPDGIRPVQRKISQKSNYIEDDAETIRGTTLKDAYWLHPDIAPGAIQVSKTLEISRKLNYIEDDAETIRDKSVDSLPLNEAIDDTGYERSIDIEYLNGPNASVAAGEICEQWVYKKNPSILKR